MWVYLWVDEQLITTAGIYHSPDLWLISISSDWNTWTTIADKNLWATVVYHDWDTLSEANCWYHFQRWNNHPYPFTWTVTTSSNRVDPTGYWPWTVNWYWNYTPFITGTNWWMTTYVADLWWYVTGTNEAMQWPCDTGYHVPLRTEIENIYNIWVNFNLRSSSSWSWVKTYLLLPFAWGRWRNGTTYNQDVEAHLGMADGASAKYCQEYLFSNSFSWYNQPFTTQWLSIRPFKNEAVQPNTGRIKLY